MLVISTVESDRTVAELIDKIKLDSVNTATVDFMCISIGSVAINV